MWGDIKRKIAESITREQRYKEALETIAEGRNEQGMYATKQILQAVAKRALKGGKCELSKM